MINRSGGGEIKHSQYFSFPDMVQLQPSIVALKLTSLHKDKGTRERRWAWPIIFFSSFLFPYLFFSIPVQYKMAKSTNTKQRHPSNSAVCGVLGHTNESLISRCHVLFTGIKYSKLRSGGHK